MKIEMATLSSLDTHLLLGSAISPRPVVLITTIGKDGVYNAAPYSAVTSVSRKPPLICVSIRLRDGKKKHTLENMEFSGDFVVNVLDDSLLKPALKTSGDYPSDVSEIEEAGLTAIEADQVESPLIGEAQVSMECKLVKTVEFGEGPELQSIIFGEVVLAHVKDAILDNGKLDPSKMATVGRVGNGVYCRTNDIIRLKG
jgi:flavin reductase (DIM6/NTAB) family NADH-FMN oxidoreductase RutF